MSLEVQEILRQLETYRGTFPRKALEAAIARRDEIAPELLKILETAGRDVQRLVADESYMAHIYAMYLLAQFRDSRAYRPIVEFFSIPGEITLDATGDTVTEDLGRILASVCNGDTRLIEGLIENQQANEYVRGAALASLVALVVAGVKKRETVLDYYGDLLRGRLEKGCTFVWAELVSCSLDLYPQELLPDIRAAFAAELIDETIISYEDVEGEMLMGKDALLAATQVAPRYQLIGNVIDEMGRWDCFKPEKGRRNAPCPCGSGKKYKMCCGRD